MLNDEKVDDKELRKQIIKMRDQGYDFIKDELESQAI